MLQTTKKNFDIILSKSIYNSKPCRDKTTADKHQVSECLRNQSSHKKSNSGKHRIITTLLWAKSTSAQFSIGITSKRLAPTRKIQLRILPPLPLQITVEENIREIQLD